MSSPLLALLEFGVACFMAGLVLFSWREFKQKVLSIEALTAYKTVFLIVSILAITSLLCLSLARLFPYFGQSSFVSYRVYMWGVCSFFLFISFCSRCVRGKKVVLRWLLLPASFALLLAPLLGAERILFISHMRLSAQGVLVPQPTIAMRLLLLFFVLVTVYEFCVWLLFFAQHRISKKISKVFRGVVIALLFIHIVGGLSVFILKKEYFMLPYDPLVWGVVGYSFYIVYLARIKIRSII